MTLVEFLRQRLDEDEAAAQRALPGPWELQGEPRETLVFSAPTGVSVAVGWLRDLDHIARHDPAPVLAEVAAKRRIVEWCGERDMIYVGTPGADPDAPRPEDFVPGALRHSRDAVVLRLLALPYAGHHPDYQEEWKP